MNPQEQKIITLLKNMIVQIPSLKDESTLDESPAFVEWQSNVSTVIRRTFGDKSSEFTKLNSINFHPTSFIIGDGYPNADDIAEEKKYYQKGLETAAAQIRSMITIIETMGLPE